MCAEASLWTSETRRAGRLEGLALAVSLLSLTACGGAPELVASEGSSETVFSEPVSEAPRGGLGSEPGAAPSAVVLPDDSCVRRVDVREAAGEAPSGGLGCIPEWGEDGLFRRLVMARVGAELVVCADEGSQRPTGCWAVDTRSGRLAPRVPAPFLGHGFVVEGTCHDGMSWRDEVPTEQREAQALFAYHPDGRRAAVLVGGRVVVFEVPSKAVVTSFPLATGAEEELSNTPVSLWFFGEMIFVAGFDAGPAAAVFAYRSSGGVVGPADWGLYNGGAGPSDGRRFGVNRDGLRELAVVDAVTGRSETVTRKVPRGTCGPGDALELAAPDPVMSELSAKCVAYLERHYSPWVGMSLLADGGGWLGLKVQGKRELVWLDASLRVTRRVALRTCRPSELPQVEDE